MKGYSLRNKVINFILNLKEEFLKFRIFFPFTFILFLKKLELFFISKVYHFYLFNKYKLLTFIKLKKYRKAFKLVQRTYLEANINIMNFFKYY